MSQEKPETNPAIKWLNVTRDRCTDQECITCKTNDGSYRIHYHTRHVNAFTAITMSSKDIEPACTIS